ELLLQRVHLVVGRPQRLLTGRLVAGERRRGAGVPLTEDEAVTHPERVAEGCARGGCALPCLARPCLGCVLALVLAVGGLALVLAGLALAHRVIVARPGRSRPGVAPGRPRWRYAVHPPADGRGAAAAVCRSPHSVG